MQIPGIPTPTPIRTNNMRTTRRGLLTLAAAGAAAVAMPLPSFALTDSEARSLISAAVSDVNAVIASGKTGPALYSAFANIFSKYADVPTIARSSLGVASRQASPAQMQAFTDAFRGYIARKYGQRFNEFVGAQFEVQGAQQVKSFYEVTTLAHLRGKNPFTVVWQVSDKSGRNLFFNLIIEGVNMLAAERTEIGSMLDAQHGDINALIKQLQASS